MSETEIQKAETAQMEALLRERALEETEDGMVNLNDAVKHMTQVFTTFASLSGAVRPSKDKPGLWEIFSPQVDQRGQPVGVVRVFFRASQVMAVGVPYEAKVPLVQVVPAGAVPSRGPQNGRG